MSSDLWRLAMEGLVTERSNPASLPITPKSTKWKLRDDPVRYTRTFKFKTVENMANFIQDVLAYEDDTNHHGKSTIEFPFVKIEVWTHTLGSVTEIDKEWTEVVDEIYKGYK